MIRVVLFLLLVGLLAIGAAWLADRPGDVTILWLGRRIETSVMVAAAAIALIAALAVMLWSLMRFILRSPRLVSDAITGRRRVRAHQVISNGLIAVGAGDARAARKFANEADRLAAEEPLALLLNAQVAQLSGDRAAAERAFRAMAARSDTRLLGLRGLYVEAQRRDDPAAARHFAEQAAEVAPTLAWAGQAALEYRCATGDWAGALTILDDSRRARLLDKASYRRQRAVLLTARALASAEADGAAAKALALEAVKLAPDLVPAAALAGSLLVAAGERRKAARILETAWRAHPHPDLAETYARLRSGDTARERLARVERLVRQRSTNPEAALAVARAALDAREFATARAALAPLLVAPSQGVAMLMAELEEVQHGDIGRAREWMARALRAPRDPAWVADGFVSDHWMPISPVTGRLDAFQWKAPIEVGDGGRMSSDPGRPAFVIEGTPAASEPKGLGRMERPAEHAGKAAEDASRKGSLPASDTASPRGGEQVVEAVIPLVHAPDDPGPDPEATPAPAADERRRLFLW